MRVEVLQLRGVWGGGSGAMSVQRCRPAARESGTLVMTRLERLTAFELEERVDEIGAHACFIA